MTDPRDRMTPEHKAAMQLGHELGQNFITDADFNEEYARAVKHAKQTLKKDGYHVHMLAAKLRSNKDGKITLIPAMFADWPPPEGKKEDTLMGVGVKFAQDCPDHTLVSVVHISEGWMANQDVYENSGKKHIEEMVDDDKLEVLNISLTTQDLRQSFSTWRIRRDLKGKILSWHDKPELEELYNPDSDIHPMADGDYLPKYAIKGYVLARAQERKHAEA